MKKWNLKLCRHQRGEWLFFFEAAANECEDWVSFLSLVNCQASLYESGTFQVAEVASHCQELEQLFLYLWLTVLLPRTEGYSELNST